MVQYHISVSFSLPVLCQEIATRVKSLRQLDQARTYIQQAEEQTVQTCDTLRLRQKKVLLFKFARAYPATDAWNVS